jgi:Tfp pilus assembly PilM family ATPase
MFNIFGSKKIIGIDLGSKNIKIVELEKYKKSFILNNYIIIEIEGGEKISNVLETSQIYEETLANILENGLKEFKTKEAVVSIPALYYFYTNFSLPYLPFNVLKNAINFESRKYIPASYEKFQLDWRNIKYSPFNLSNQDKWFIFLTALPESYLNKVKNIAQLTKIKFQKAYPEFFALEPFFKDNKENIILIDVGYSYAYAVFIKENQIIYAQKIKLTIKNIIDTLSKLFSINYQEAENIFIKKGFNILPEEIDLKKTFEEIVNNFSEEILKIKENWENTFNTKINLIYLQGGLSLANGLIDKLSSKIVNASVVIFNPLEKNLVLVSDKIKSKTKGSILVQALGSSMKFLSN